VGKIKFMALITTGKQLIRDLKGALGIYVPPEGGFEGYRRRLVPLVIPLYTYGGLGDLAAYLTSVHGVRPHLVRKILEFIMYLR